MKNKRIISIFIVLTMMLTLFPMNSLVAYGSEATDTYNYFRTKFEPVLDNHKATLVLLLDAFIDDNYDAEIEEALDEVSDETLDLLEANGFIDLTDDVVDYSGLSDVLQAVNDLIYGDYDGESLATIINHMQEDGEELTEDTKAEIKDAYTYLYNNLPLEVKEDFSKYGETTKDRALILADLIRYIYTTGETLVRSVNGNIEITLYNDYIDKANELLEEKVNDGETPIVLNNYHEEAINVFLDIVGQKLSSYFYVDEDEDGILDDKYDNLVEMIEEVELFSFDLDEFAFMYPRYVSPYDDYAYVSIIADYFAVPSYRTIDDTNSEIILSPHDGSDDIYPESEDTEYDFEDGLYMEGRFINIPEGDYSILLKLKDDDVYVDDYVEDFIVTSTDRPIVGDVDTDTFTRGAKQFNLDFNMHNIMENRSDNITLQLLNENDTIVASSQSVLIPEDDYFEDMKYANLTATMVSEDNQPLNDEIYYLKVFVDDIEAYFAESDDNEIRTVVVSDPGDDDDDDTPGGGSGGGSGGTPADDDDDVVVTVPEDDDEPVEAEIGEDAVETEENEDGQTEATVKEEAITKAVESIVKAIEEAGETTATKNAAVTIPVKANDENLVVKLPSKAMTSLAENNVGLNIKSEKMEYNVPAGAIDEEVLEEFGEEVTVQFNSKKVNVEEAFKDIEVAPEFAMKDKIIELSLDVLDNDGKKVGSISEFKKPLTIKISLDDVDGDPDRLGVYFINPETKKPEFVGGKVVNGMLVFKVSHYSRYAVMEANKTYPDLAGHWSKANVESMAAKHVVSGYPDGTYKPENNITRAEFANLIVKALELDVVEYNNEFNDINAADWYADVVATAYANGIIDGYPEGTFLPNKEISRLEMAAMLSKALDVEINDNYYPMAAQAFGDYSDIASWGKDHMVKVYQEGLMVGMDGVFNPTGTTTRAQAATAIYRLYNK